MTLTVDLMFLYVDNKTSAGKVNVEIKFLYGLYTFKIIFPYAHFSNGYITIVLKVVFRHTASIALQQYLFCL